MIYNVSRDIIYGLKRLTILPFKKLHVLSVTTTNVITTNYLINYTINSFKYSSNTVNELIIQLINYKVITCITNSTHSGWW